MGHIPRAGLPQLLLKVFIRGSFRFEDDTGLCFQGAPLPLTAALHFLRQNVQRL